ncbi:porin [Comamonas testosteroni]|uniref:porin n=1 Tax=Comamonas testosteroni TaxID=285 RepID=UPI0002DF7580|nr:porin [Comamonas testosteroni]
MTSLQSGGLAVAAAFISACSLAQAQTAGPATSQVTLYGVVDMAAESVSTGAGRTLRAESGVLAGSRWGVRGTEDLGGGLRALYVMEAGLNADTGERGQGGLAFGRQIFVGMGGDWGQLTVGRHYTTFHTSLASYALTGLIWGNAANYFRDGTVLRADNSLRFQSASMAGLVVRGMYSFGENAGTNVGRQFGGSLDYTRGPWSLGASLWERRTTAQNTDRYHLLGGSYDFKVARAALLLSTRGDDLLDAASNRGRFFEVSMTIPVSTAGQVLLSYGQFQGRARANSDARALSVRYDHALSKRTKLYAGVSAIRNEADAAFTINSASNAGPSVPKGSKPRSLLVGISHSF